MHTPVLRSGRARGHRPGIRLSMASAVAFAGLSALFAPPAGASASYEIEGLGTLGGLSTEAAGVNDARQVAGSLTGT